QARYGCTNRSIQFPERTPNLAAGRTRAIMRVYRLAGGDGYLFPAVRIRWRLTARFELKTRRERTEQKNERLPKSFADFGSLGGFYGLGLKPVRLSQWTCNPIGAVSGQIRAEHDIHRVCQGHVGVARNRVPGQGSQVGCPGQP